MRWCVKPLWELYGARCHFLWLWGHLIWWQWHVGPRHTGPTGCMQRLAEAICCSAGLWVPRGTVSGGGGPWGPCLSPGCCMEHGSFRQKVLLAYAPPPPKPGSPDGSLTPGAMGRETQ